MEDNTLDPYLIHAIFKFVWSKRAPEREKNKGTSAVDCQTGVGTSKKVRSTSEAVQRAATIAEVEGDSKIEATHLERILPQLLLDF